MCHLLRIEAVNLRFVIDDTEDLSTRRGGSAMLLDAVNQLAAEYSEKIEPISTGASVGLFAVKSGSADADKLTTDIRQFLQKSKTPYSHATFVVDLVQAPHFRCAAEMAVSTNRWQQMQTLNFRTNWGNAKVSCEIDEVRPASAEIRLPDNKTVPASASVETRREAGRKLRQSLYKQILGNETGKKFTDDTASLSCFSGSEFAAIPPNLNGKMAVFYADGNRFGQHQRDCEDATSLKNWDAAIKTKRQSLLRDLLAWLDATPLAKTDQGALRFETLLWGGDELLFLVPAWLGLAFAEKFFELTAGWTYGGSSLTHAAGLVFAKHSTPISSLQKLAKQLAEHGKTEQRALANTLSWVVLESFDYTGDQFDDFWTRNGISKNGWDKLLLTPERLQTLRAMVTLKDVLPRSAMVRALRTLASERSEAEHKLLQSTYQSTTQALNEEQRQVWDKLWKSLVDAEWSAELPKNEGLGDWAQQQAVAWTALLELWDYILPIQSAVSAQEDAA